MWSLLTVGNNISNNFNTSISDFPVFKTISCDEVNFNVIFLLKITETDASYRGMKTGETSCSSNNKGKKII